MTTTICDSCKKAVPASQAGVNLEFIRDKTLCYPCMKKLEDSVSQEIWKSSKYEFSRYQKVFLSMLDKHCK